MTLNYCTFLLWLILFVACTDNPKKSSNQKKVDQSTVDETQLLLNQLEEFDFDSNLSKSPMRLYAFEFNDLTNRVIAGLDQSKIDNNEVFERILFLRYKANTHKIDDSLTKEIDTILTFQVEKKYVTQEVKRRLLRANYLFVKEMLVALERIKQNQDTIPYLISGDEKIVINNDMNAVIVIPKKDIIESISFNSPNDSMIVDYKSDHFIWVLARPRSKQDSISTVIKFKNTNEPLVLTKHYEVLL